MIDGDAVLDEEHDDDDDLESSPLGHSTLTTDENGNRRLDDGRLVRRVLDKLTTDERLRVAQDMVELEQDIEAKEQARKDASKAAKAEIDSLQQKVRDMRDGVTKGEMMRDVEVYTVARDTVIATLRVDNAKTIDTRQMTEAERQQHLFDQKIEPGSEEQAKRRKRGAKKSAAEAEEP